MVCIHFLSRHQRLKRPKHNQIVKCLYHCSRVFGFLKWFIVKSGRFAYRLEPYLLRAYFKVWVEDNPWRHTLWCVSIWSRCLRQRMYPSHDQLCLKYGVYLQACCLSYNHEAVFSIAANLSLGPCPTRREATKSTIQPPKWGWYETSIVPNCFCEGFWQWCLTQHSCLPYPWRSSGRPSLGFGWCCIFQPRVNYIFPKRQVLTQAHLWVGQARAASRIALIVKFAHFGTWSSRIEAPWHDEGKQASGGWALPKPLECWTRWQRQSWSSCIDHNRLRTFYVLGLARSFLYTYLRYVQIHHFIWSSSSVLLHTKTSGTWNLCCLLRVGGWWWC